MNKAGPEHILSINKIKLMTFCPLYCGIGLFSGEINKDNNQCAGVSRKSVSKSNA